MHFHTYIYEARHGERPRWDANQLEPGGISFSVSPFPPSLIAHWLRKPTSFIKATFDEPADAVAWASERLQRAYGGEEPSGMPITDRERHGVSQLSMGNDLCWANHGSGQVYTEIYVVCCPNSGGSAPCPIGRRDSRPEGATKMTGIP